MTDNTDQGHFANSLLKSRFDGFRQGNLLDGAKIFSQYCGTGDGVPSTTSGSQIAVAAKYLVEVDGRSLLKRIGVVSANATAAEHPLALHDIQDTLKRCYAAGELGKKGVEGTVNPGAFNAVTTPLRMSQSLWGVIPMLLNNDGGTFGIVGTGGPINQPTTSPLPRPTTAAMPTKNATLGAAGEDGYVSTPTATTKPISRGHPAVVRLHDIFGTFLSLSRLDKQIQ